MNINIHINKASGMYGLKFGCLFMRFVGSWSFVIWIGGRAKSRFRAASTLDTSKSVSCKPLYPKPLNRINLKLALKP